jgi:ABC-2 type transport system permease protein
MKTLDLASKDLLQIFRDRKSFLFLLAMPIVFTLFMGFAYRGAPSQETDNRIPVGWIDNDPDGLLSRTLYAALQDSEAIKLALLETSGAADAVSKGSVAGVVIIPVGFSAQALAGENVQLTLLTDPNSTTGQTIFQALRSPISRLMSAAEIARLSAGALGKPGDETEMNAAFQLAAQAWQDAPGGVSLRTELAVAAKQESWFGDNPYNQASPGILVQFAVFGLVTSAQIVVQERKTRTLQRLLTTAIRPWQVFAGHWLAMFAVVMMQELILIVFGQFVLGVNYAQAPLATLLVAMTLGLWVSAMGLLIGVLARGEDQVVLLSLLAMFILSALGGTWFPLEAAGKGFGIVGRMTPTAWAMTGFQNILIRGQGLAAVWLPSAIMLAFAAGFFALAVWGFRRIEA